MSFSKDFHKIFDISPTHFPALALEVFDFQYHNNPLYRSFVDTLHIKIEAVDSVEKIPFLPVSFFKTHAVHSTIFEHSIVFESSGTTGSISSRHELKDVHIYEQSFRKGFEQFYGNIGEYCILGLLPSYLEKGGSSLVYMVNDMIRASNHPNSGFYLHDTAALAESLRKLESQQQKTLLIGVTYALIDFAEKYPMPLKHTIVMETGGMKGRKREMLRLEVQALLKKAFQLPVVHSEYGMTELLSQAYSKGNGLFESPPWMKILLRDEEDPLAVRTPDDRQIIGGAINIIDLANIYSCSFIATDDAGRLHPDGRFEIMGRLDNSDLRGCSLLIATDAVDT
ncbi:MAG: acyl transferase [Pedobacter sp.]|nr:MAG: acyl transferase [Pedobacter sp.]